MATNEGIQTVCIDTVVRRRISRLSGLSLTDSIGILLRAKREGYLVSMQQAIERMRNRSIRLRETVVTFALEQAGESDISRTVVRLIFARPAPHYRKRVSTANHADSGQDSPQTSRTQNPPHRNRRH
ncbi:DUF3368 domain-containing protein [Coleofasciculus sp. FACHB-1120]|uniref:DUF3368 domain-containing protein n=1 Tax=Coleofasciculus sp. FACHB-1120 TaxID=2692783 RepID=UPI0018EF6133|nr:DUF3368 domain-containing protein [Coleofasciculus sp. FACHB-1120]